MTTMKYIGIGIGGVVGLLIVFYLLLMVWGAWHDEWSGYNWSTRWAVSDGYCNIALIPIIGDIVTGYTPSEEGEYAITGSDDVLRFIERAEADERIKGILLQIDSYGGYPVAGEMITNSVKRSSLPSGALIREVGASAAYMIASAADTIISSPLSDVGGIGITMSYTGNWEQNDREGRTFVSLSSAPFKDYGHPDKPLTEAERTVLERDLNIAHDYFVKLVAENRNMPIEKVAELADGSSMIGLLALENGLVDQLGDIETARDWFADELGLPAEEVVFCTL